MNRIASALAAMALAAPVMADEVGITPEMMSVTVPTASGPVEIKRIQDTGAVIEGEFAQIARPCPNFCIQPMIPAEGVTTVGELEVLAALQDPDTLVVDGRIRPEFDAGTIPGAISVPYNESADRMDVFGCELDFDGFLCDGEDVKNVLLFCNGPWCGQSPTAARRLIEAGFPAEKISYYRGGMQMWRMLGLTVVPGAGS